MKKEILKRLQVILKVFVAIVLVFSTITLVNAEDGDVDNMTFDVSGQLVEAKETSNQVKISLKITNTSETDLTLDSIKADIPEGVDFVSTEQENAPSQEDDSLLWTHQSLSANKELVLTYELDISKDASTQMSWYVNDVKLKEITDIKDILSDEDIQKLEGNTQKTVQLQQTEVKTAVFQAKGGQQGGTSTYVDAELDETYIRVQKTFTGSEGNVPTNFSIDVHENNAGGRVIAHLTLDQATKNGNTYTWTINSVGEGTYYAVENNADKITGYKLVSHTGDGVAASVKAAQITYKGGRYTPGDKFEIVFSGNMVATSLPDGTFFIWTEDHLSASERLAIVNNIKTAGGTFGKMTVNNTKFFSGQGSIESEDGLHYRDIYKIFNKDGVRTLGLYLESGKGAQWNMLAMGTYSFSAAQNAEIAIGNTYDKNVTSISGTKTWVNVPEGSKYPTVIIELYQDDVKYKETTIKNGGTSYKFEGLPKYKTDGTEYIYTVQEVELEGYESSKDGYNFTNTMIIGDLIIKKQSFGTTTPQNTVFTITGPHDYSKEVKYSEFTNGQYELKGLPVGEYKVVESNANVKGYKLTVTGNGSTANVNNDKLSEFNIVNSYVSDKKASLIIYKVLSRWKLLRRSKLPDGKRRWRNH